MRVVVQGLEGKSRRSGEARGFTLVEVLVVVLIVVLVSAAALPTVVSAIGSRQLPEAARLLQGALAGARDRAIHTGAPCGIRLLPDPQFMPQWPNDPTTGQPTTPILSTTPLAYNRIIPLESAPEYSEGLCIPVPTAAYKYWRTNGGAGYPATQQYSVAWDWIPGGPVIPPALMVVQSPATVISGTAAPNPPTNWFWNIRVGDQIQINNAGTWYTVVGPMIIPPSGTTINGQTYGNPEGFVNVGPPAPVSFSPPAGSTDVPGVSVLGGAATPVEYLFLVNGQDDNSNGYIDEGADGVDNNGDGQTDEYQPNNTFTPNGFSAVQIGNPPQTVPPLSGSFFRNEWEIESWAGAIEASPIANVPYTIQRRPAPSSNAKEVDLPNGVVIDATTWGGTRERSRLPVNQNSGNIDIVINPDGTVATSTGFSTPASFGMANAFYHFWLASRADVVAPNTAATAAPYLPVIQPSGSATPASLGVAPPWLDNPYALISLNTRTGQIVSNSGMPFYRDSLTDPQSKGLTNFPGVGGTYNPTYPFIQAEQGTMQP